MYYTDVDITAVRCEKLQYKKQKAEINKEIFMNLFFPLALIMALIIFVFWGGRAPHEQRKIFFGWYYADGGVTGPDDKLNSVAAFRKCVDNGVGIKVKTVISKDNKPIIADRDDLTKEGFPDVKVSESDSEELLDEFLETISY